MTRSNGGRTPSGQSPLNRPSRNVWHAQRLPPSRAWQAFISTSSRPGRFTGPCEEALRNVFIELPSVSQDHVKQSRLLQSGLMCRTVRMVMNNPYLSKGNTKVELNNHGFTAQASALVEYKSRGHYQRQTIIEKPCQDLSSPSLKTNRMHS